MFFNERGSMRKLFIALIFAFLMIFQATDMKAVDYALTQAYLVKNNCQVIALIRGDTGMNKVVYESEKSGDLCTVKIEQAEFEKHFSYCVLSGIHSEKPGKFTAAAFGGGPAGGKAKKYWFEWGDPSYVQPDFYCMLK